MKAYRDRYIFQSKPRASRLSSAGRWTAGLLITAVVIFAGRGGPATAAPNKLDDADITAAVETNLNADPAIAAHLIDVVTFDGIVTLDGKVPDLLSKERATRVAESITGVLSVVNTLKLTPRLRSDLEIRRDIEEALIADPAADSYEISVAVARHVRRYQRRGRGTAQEEVVHEQYQVTEIDFTIAGDVAQDPCLGYICLNQR